MECPILPVRGERRERKSELIRKTTKKLKSLVSREEERYIELKYY